MSNEERELRERELMWLLKIYTTMNTCVNMEEIAMKVIRVRMMSGMIMKKMMKMVTHLDYLISVTLAMMKRMKRMKRMTTWMTMITRKEK